MGEELQYLIRIALDKTGAQAAQTELRKMGAEAERAAQKLDSSYRTVGTAITSATQQTKEGAVTTTKMTQTMQNASGQHKKFTQAVQQSEDGLRRMDSATKVTTGSLNAHEVSTRGVIVGYIKLASRAIAVIPIWMALRAVMLSVTNTMRDTTKSIISIDKALQFAKNELVGIQDVDAVLDKLRETAIRLALDTGKSVDEIIESFRLFKTAGIGVAESMAGMETAVKGALATQGDTTKIAKLLADIYNLVGDRITEVSGEQEKFNFIMSTMTQLMPTNVINIKEYEQALKNFAATAKTSGLNLDQMLTLVAVSSTLMQRGSRSGTRLATAFTKLSTSTKDVEKFLGRPIDVNVINDFELLLEVIEKASTLSEADLDINKPLQEIFGLRSGRIIKSFVADVSKLIEEYTKLGRVDVAGRMENLNQRVENANEAIDIQLKRLKQVREELGRTFVEGITGGKNFAETLERIIDKLLEMKPLLKEVAEASGGLIRDVGEGVQTFTRPEQTQVGQEIIRQTTQGKGANDFSRAVGETLEAFDLFGGVFKALNESLKLGDVTDKLVEQEEELKSLEQRRRIGEERAKAGLSPLREEEVNLGILKIEKDKADIQKRSLLDIKERLAIAESLAILGFNELEIEQRKLEILKESTADEDTLLKQRLKIAQVLTKETLAFSNAIKDSFQGGLSDILLGEGDLANLGVQIGDSIKKGLVDSLTGAVTDAVFKSTGMGALFGNIFTNIRHGGDSLKGSIASGFDEGAAVTKRAIIDGFNVATGGGATGSSIATFGGGLGGGGMTLPGFGEGGFFNNIVGGGPRALPRPKGFIGPMPQAPTATFGQAAGAIGGAGLLGFSAFQQAGGAEGGGLAIGAGALGSLGGLALGGSLLGFGAGAGAGAFATALAPLLGPIGIALAAGALIMSAFAKTTQEQVSEKTQTKQVASKLDISNNKLELINRNLVALRTVMETFILPESSYFSEGRNLEDNFSIDSRR